MPYMASVKFIFMKYLYVIVALFSFMMSNSQDTIIKPQKKSFLQRQIENPNSALYGQSGLSPNESKQTSKRKFGDVHQQDLKFKNTPKVYESSVSKLQQQAEDAINNVEENRHILEMVEEDRVQQEEDAQLLYNITKEKEAKIKQIISQKAKINQLKIKEIESKIFRDKVVNYSILTIAILASILLFTRIIKSINFKSIKPTFRRIYINNINTKIPKLGRIEIYIIALSVGVIISVVFGNLLPSYDYYKLSRKQGQAIKVSEGLSTYSIESFNFKIAIITFLVTSLLIYFTLRRTTDNK